MTVSTVQARVSYSGNGATTQFSVPFLFHDDGDLKVQLVDANGVINNQTLSADYTLSGAGNPAGGTLTMTTAPAAGETLYIIQNRAPTQDIDFIDDDPLPAETLELGYDRLATGLIKLEDQISRAIRQKDADPAATLDLPVKATRADKILAFDANGDLIVSSLTLAQLEQTVQPDADAISFTPTGNVAANDVQAAIAELDNEKQPLDATLTALAGLATGANTLPYFSGNDQAAQTALTAFARTLLDDPNASTMRATLGLIIGTDVAAQSHVGSGGAVHAGVVAGGAAGFMSGSDKQKLDGIEGGATADQSDAEIETAYNNQVSIVPQAEAEAGTSTTVRRWTAQRVKQAILALGTGDAWGDAVDSDIIPDGDGTRNLGATATRFANIFGDALDITNNIIVGGTVDGRDVASDGSKLDGIESGADVTDNAAVAAAGAVMDGDFPSEVGVMRRTGAGAYSVLKDNLNATVAPGSTDDANAGYGIGSLWVDTIANKSYICVDNTATAAIWNDLTATGGSGEANTASNVGTGVDIFKQKTGVDLEFRGLISTTGALSFAVNGDNVEGSIATASATQPGLAEKATQAEVDGESDDTRFITPAKLKSRLQGFRGINSQTGASYTAVADDAGKVIVMNNAGAITLNINNSVFSANDVITVLQKGSGNITVAGTASINTHSSKTKESDGQYSWMFIFIETGGAGTVGYLDGNLVAA